ncbi:IS3 family transposase [Allosaccharopolyspora coralli]|uniref:IS3 family transposase n=1 Tax=Allosaccharopolyspora coralli TaxID=2665642 RepID=A0A5Q3QH48_9PSEU|nr:IS3 family transposase [Allosaccharopolyspora coralli]
MGEGVDRVTRYRFVDSQKADGFTVAAACHAAGVSTSAYYDWRRAQASEPSPAQQAEDDLVTELHSVHEASGGTYGSPRVHAELRHRGWVVNHKRVERLMRAHDLVGVHPRKRVRTTVPADQPEPAPDLLGRDFMPGLPDQRWASDITYIPTDEGWLYLAAVLDVGSRRVLGYAMASYLRTDLVADCLDNAVATRGGNVAGVIFHSDRGCQYTSAQFAQHCRELGIRRSLGRTGICWDNAIVESFFGALKRELVHRHRFTTRAQARQAIFVWIQTWYNRRRLHSTLGYASPEQWEQQEIPEAA